MKKYRGYISQSKMDDIPPITKEFTKFIQRLLKIGKLKEKHIELYTNKESIVQFRMAFTHPSYNSSFNSERMELFGDVSLNLGVMEYLAVKYPDIINVNWLTRMKHTLISKKYLAIMAERHNFGKHILYSDEAKNDMERDRDNSTWNDMLEDSVEALFGAIRSVTLLHNIPWMVYINITKNIIWDFLDDLNIDPYDYTAYFDPVSLLKEIHDAKWWNFDASVKYNQNPETGEHTISIETYPLGNKTRNPKNVIVFTAKGFDKKKTKNAAAQKAIDGLHTNYGIRGKIPDPYARNVWKSKYKEKTQKKHKKYTQKYDPKVRIGYNPKQH